MLPQALRVSLLALSLLVATSSRAEEPAQSPTPICRNKCAHVSACEAHRKHGSPAGGANAEQQGSVERSAEACRRQLETCLAQCEARQKKVFSLGTEANEPPGDTPLERARSLSKAGRDVDALAPAEEAAAALRRTKDPELADAIAELAMIQFRLGKVEQARKTAEQSLAALSKDSWHTIRVLGTVADVYWETGRRGQAIAALDRAFVVCDADRECANRPALMITHAKFLDAIGKHEAAISELSETIDRCKSIQDPHFRNGWEAKTLANLGAAYAHNGEAEKALATLEKAEQAFVEVFGDADAETVALRTDIATFRRDLGTNRKTKKRP